MNELIHQMGKGLADRSHDDDGVLSDGQKDFRCLSKTYGLDHGRSDLTHHGMG